MKSVLLLILLHLFAISYKYFAEKAEFFHNLLSVELHEMGYMVDFQICPRVKSFVRQTDR